METELDRLRLLEKVIYISNATVDIERRLKNLMQLFCREADIDCSCLFSFDRGRKSLTLQVTDRNGENEAEVCFRPDHLLFSDVLAKRAPVVLNPDDLEVDEASQPPFFQSFKCMALFPIKDDQLLYGVLVLLHHEAVSYERDRISLFETITSAMAGTLRAARVYEESKNALPNFPCFTKWPGQSIRPLSLKMS